MTNWIKKIYDFVLLYQIILFFIFIIENYLNLDEIEINIAVGSFESSITINLYVFLLGLGAIYAVLILLGINVLGSGLSDSALQTVGKFVKLASIYTILLISTTYYLQFLSEFGIIINILIFVIYLLEGINNVGVSSNDS